MQYVWIKFDRNQTKWTCLLLMLPRNDPKWASYNQNSRLPVTFQGQVFENIFMSLLMIEMPHKLHVKLTGFGMFHLNEHEDKTWWVFWACENGPLFVLKWEMTKRRSSLKRFCCINLPWSLEMSGLYQNLDVSCTNLTVTLLASTSAKQNAAEWILS